MTQFPKNTKVQILVNGEWTGPYAVTAFEGRTPEHLVLSGPSGMFEHYHDGAFNTRVVPEEPAAAVAKIRKGDEFHNGTSPTVYTATADETARGYVRAVAFDISVGCKVLFNSNEDALTVTKRAGDA